MKKRAKVTEAVVLAIAAAYEGGATMVEIGAAHGICQAHVGNILRGDVWKKVPRKLFAVGRGGYATNSAQKTRHGHSLNGKSPEYMCWQAMKARCQDPNSEGYKYYGGRGIKVCERWQTFENFLADMGHRPSSVHSIERERVNEGYEPGNCHWGTVEEQANNKRSSHRITIDGETLTMAQWARRQGVRTCVIMNRLRRGWPEREAVLKPRKFKRLAA